MKYTKPIGIILLILIIFSVSFFLKPKVVKYKAGSYRGASQGHIGPIKVLVTTNEYEIEEIKITEEYEMPEISKHVYDKIPNKIIRKNNADVEVISGATYTSKGLIEAIAEALDEAQKGR